MPLHLLGKKSWNVYNPENIARVRRDEAEAEAREVERERQQEEDEAERRLAQLRGEPHIPTEDVVSSTSKQDDRGISEPYHKKRKLAGENDTDRDIRIAAQQSQRSETKRSRSGSSDVYTSLLGRDGHIDLIQNKDAAKTRNTATSNKDKNNVSRLEDQGYISLKSAVNGHANNRKPWYSTPDSSSSNIETVGRDVWGNEDPRRKQREERRLNSSDPLAAMKKGIKQLREIESERQRWRKERERDLEGVQAPSQNHHSRKRRRESEADSLEDFDLDRGYSHARKEISKHRHRHKHRYKHDSQRHHRHRQGDGD